MRKAFTLAEVLITLGIIGIVAAMTLPTLVQKNQKQVAATRLKQTYSQLYFALNRAQAEYGDMKNWSVNDNNGSTVPDVEDRLGLVKKFAETYFVPYLKYTGKSDVYSLRERGYSAYKTKDGRGYRALDDKLYIVELTNGVTLFFYYNGNGTTGKMSYPLIYVDINGKTKPNILGRDFFLFDLDSVSTMRIRPYGIGYSREELLEKCKPDAGQVTDNLFCTALIAQDGWEIKKDYPW